MKRGAHRSSTRREHPTRGVRTVALALGCFAVGLLAAPRAQAGCGCEKAPPDTASVRPNATYVGADVTLFDPALQVGETYTVEFASGTTSATATVEAVAVDRRDLADGVYRPQLVVVLPDLPLGPTSVTVSDASGVVMSLDDSALTAVPAPVTIPAAVGSYSVPDFQAAVGRDGTIYVSLDMSAIHQPRVVRAQALGYPLRFTNNDVVFYNVQGFLMQLLGEDMPGLYSIATATGSGDSDVLQYSRHEFNTWFLQHDERQAHAVDPADPYWHLDGTPHIDHDSMILAIAGVLDDGTAPVPGATPPFELTLDAVTLFDHGLVGTSSVNMLSNTFADSYDSTAGWYGAAGNVGSQGNVLSNGEVRVSDSAVVNGNATASSFDLVGGGSITGTMTTATQATEFLPVEVPDGVEDLGYVTIPRNQTLTLLGPATFLIAELVVQRGGELLIDNSAGPVILYVTGDITVESNAKKVGRITSVDEDPEKFAIYVTAGNEVVINGNGTGFINGLLYAPQCHVTLKHDSQFFGAVVGGDLRLEGSSAIHFDTALWGE